MRYYYRPGHSRADDLGYVSQTDLDEIPMEAPQAKHAPIMVDRFYEGTKGPSGEDLGSRAKHRAFQKESGLAMASDYNPDYFERRKKAAADETKRSRREVLARKMWEIDKP